VGEARPDDERERRRSAVGELGAALRDLADAAVRTEVGEEELAAATAAARELTRALGARSRELLQVAAVDDPDAGERWYSPVYGPGSPIAPPLELDPATPGTAIGRVTVRKPHEGPPGLVHGGVTATLLDHVLARAVRSAGHGGLTAQLTVRFRRPVRLGTPLVVSGELVSVEGRRATGTARVTTETEPDVVLAEADGLFVALRPDRAASVFAGTDRAVRAWTASTD
jgi:uncharacterized protein (TIGR00369 family)